MRKIGELEKQILFGGTIKKIVRPMSSYKSKTKYKTTSFQKTAAVSSGMMQASEFPIADNLKKPSERGKKKVISGTKKSEPARYQIYRNINKIGLMALAGGTILNHSINTTHKLMAAVEGNADKFRYYEDKNKNYMKPHFSLPSQWHQPRITFGTPWYY